MRLLCSGLLRDSAAPRGLICCGPIEGRRRRPRRPAAGGRRRRRCFRAKRVAAGGGRLGARPPALAHPRTARHRQDEDRGAPRPGRAQAPLAACRCRRRGGWRGGLVAVPAAPRESARRHAQQLGRRRAPRGSAQAGRARRARGSPGRGQPGCAATDGGRAGAAAPGGGGTEGARTQRVASRARAVCRRLRVAWRRRSGEPADPPHRPGRRLELHQRAPAGRGGGAFPPRRPRRGVAGPSGGTVAARLPEATRGHTETTH